MRAAADALAPQPPAHLLGHPQPPGQPPAHSCAPLCVCALSAFPPPHRRRGAERDSSRRLQRGHDISGTVAQLNKLFVALTSTGEIGGVYAHALDGDTGEQQELPGSPWYVATHNTLQRSMQHAAHTHILRTRPRPVYPRRTTVCRHPNLRYNCRAT